jgi:hypothetical protein
MRLRTSVPSPSAFTRTYPRRRAAIRVPARMGNVRCRKYALSVTRREYSLAYKVMHWLLPLRVPVDDSFVLEVLGVPASWDHPQAYRMVAEKTFAVAAQVDANSNWFGAVEPLSPLRALDKLMWWVGGGEAGAAAAEVRDLWRVIRGLSLRRP